MSSLSSIEIFPLQQPPPPNSPPLAPPPSPDNGELKYAAWDIRLDIIPPSPPPPNTTEWPETYLHHIDKIFPTFIRVYYTFNSLCLFLIGWKCTVNFWNQCLGRHLAANNTIIVLRSLKVTGNHFMFARFVLLADFIFLHL